METKVSVRLKGKESHLQVLFQGKLRGIRQTDRKLSYVVVPGWVLTFDFSFSPYAECLSAISVHAPYQLMIPNHEK